VRVLIFTLLVMVASSTHAKGIPEGFKRSPASIKGTAEVVLQPDFKNYWIRLEGDSAKALYEALAGEGKNNQGEAGESIFFKYGKSYSCFLDKTSNSYACTITIKDPAKGQLK